MSSLSTTIGINIGTGRFLTDSELTEFTDTINHELRIGVHLDCSKTLKQLQILSTLFKRKTDFEKVFIIVQMGEMGNMYSKKTGEHYTAVAIRGICTVVVPLVNLKAINLSFADVTFVEDSYLVDVIRLLERHCHLQHIVLPTSINPPEEIMVDILSRISTFRELPFNIYRWDEEDHWYRHSNRVDIPRASRVFSRFGFFPGGVNSTVSCVVSCVHLVGDTLTIDKALSDTEFEEACNYAASKQFSRIDVVITQEYEYGLNRRPVNGMNGWTSNLSQYSQFESLKNLLMQMEGGITHLTIKGRIGSVVDYAYQYPSDGMTRMYIMLRDIIRTVGYGLVVLDMSDVTPNPTDDTCAIMVKLLSDVKSMRCICLPLSYEPCMPVKVRDSLRYIEKMSGHSVIFSRWRT